MIYCFTFKMMLSLDTTVTTVPTGMSSAASETERHSSPSILTYPLPPAGMVSMTLPCLPIKASALLLRSPALPWSLRTNGGRTKKMQSKEAATHTSTCAQKGRHTAATMIDANAPTAKQRK